MDRTFLNSPLARALRIIFDLMVLNWLWIICSLPIVTIGPATSALFSVTLKAAAREEDTPIVKSFFAAFKKNFKQAFLLGLIFIAGAFVLWTDVSFALSQAGGMRSAFLAVSVIVAAALLIFFGFAFSQQAMFDNTLKKYVVNSFALAFCAPAKTLLILLILAAPICAAMFFPEIFIERLGFFYLMAGVSGPVYLASFTLWRIYDAHIGAS